MDLVFEGLAAQSARGPEISVPARKQTSVGSINDARARCVSARFVIIRVLAQADAAMPISSTIVAPK